MGLKGNVLPRLRKFGPKTWVRGLLGGGGALYSAKYGTPGGGSRELSFAKDLEQNEENESKPQIPPPLPAPGPPCAAGVASRRPGARWPKPARSGPGEDIRGGPGRGPATGPAAGRPRRFAIRIRPADVRSGCRAPPGGRFYIVRSLRSSGDRAKGRDLAAVPGEALRAAGVTGGIVPVVPWRRRVARSPEIGGAGF